MTQINRMVLQGFKSFAKKTELVFGNQFNCVLGPNGSGKSNIGDALCFVLGKTSAKSMRAEKSSNLIYNGGKSKRPAKQAEVSMFFDNTSKVFPVDTEEVKISRVVKGNGQSVYLINDEKKTRSQVVELLNVVNINPDGYNIILQGDIVRFVEMSADERRKIIEEVAGISIYEEKKQKAMNELNKVEEKLQEADIILKEREGSLKALKKDRDQAQKYRTLESQIKTNKASYLHIQMDRKQKKLDVVNEKLEKEQAGFKEVEEKIATQKTSVEEKKESIAAINKELEEKGTKEQNLLQQSIQELNVNIATSKQRQSTIAQEIEKLTEKESQLKEDRKDTIEKIKEAERNQKETEKMVKEKEKLLGELDKRLKGFKEKCGFDKEPELSGQIEELEKEVEDKQKQIQELREKQQEFMREKDKYDVQLDVIDEKITKVLELEKENKEQIAQLKVFKQDFKKATLDLNKCLNDDASLTSQMRNARERMHDANGKLMNLQAKSSGLAERMAGSEAIKSIMAQKGKIKGIHGTVSELGNVSKKFALALEVAAGGRLKSIVVESDQVAAQCISFLKKNRLGVATFLPLNKIRERVIDPRVAKLAKDTNGAYGLAIDLVDFEPKFKKVFSYVLGGTVVTDSIATQRKIGIGTAKMVTLEGDLAEESGAMKGGFRDKKRSSFGFMEKEVARDLKEYEQIAADAQSVLSNLQKKKDELDEQIVSLREKKANLEGEIIKLERSLHLESDDLEASKQLKKEIIEKSKKLEVEIDRVSDDIIEMNRELATNKGKREQLRFQITKLKRPETLAELAAFEDKRQQLRESLINLQSDLKRLNTELDTIYRPEQVKMEKIFNEMAKEREKFKTEGEELKVKLKDLQVQLKESTEKQKKFFAEFKEHYTRRDKLNNEINDLQNKIDKLYEKLRDLDHRSGKITSEKVMLETEMTALKREFAEFEGVELDLKKSEEQLKKEINQFDRMINDLGSINLKAIDIYDSVEKEYNELVSKKEKLGSEREDVLALMNEIESKKKELFMQTFDVLHENFKRIFSSLSSKGNAQLVLEEPDDPLSAGVLVRVRLSGNKYLDIRSLSGGEKTMTALSFIFAVQEHEPASFYILDEVDAALDKNNAHLLANLVRKYCDNAQYIVISHNDAVISEADRLYGVSMNEHGMSNIVSLKI